MIALLGLYSLAAYTAEQKTKEIGIRKTLGADVKDILGLLTGDFVVLVIVANVISIPVSFYILNRWLENFAYRVDIGWSAFFIGAVLVISVSIITISGQAIKAALTNPVEALRYE